MLNVLWKCALTMVQSSAEIEPFEVSKGNEICLCYSSVIGLKISREFFAIAAVRDPSMLDI